MRQLSITLFLVATACGGGGSDPSSPIGCDDTRTECDGVCVDTTGDPLHCGDCPTACATGEVCFESACTPWDCREQPCPGLSYCELSTGTCIAGCAFTEQCGPNEECALDSHSCECESNAHRCAGACSPDTSVETCGDRCEPCPGDPHGDPICANETCSLACDPGTKLCGGRCAECPSGTSFGCDGDQCVPNNCAAGSLLCDGTCVDCPIGTDFTCAAGACVATSCPGGYELCGGSCAACPDATETACDGAACIAVACPAGEVTCATGCCPWQFEDVTTEYAQGLDLALGAGGARAISYEVLGEYVKLARKTGSGAWTIETVNSDRDPYMTAVALDASGAARIAFVDANVSYWHLWVATKVAGAWSSNAIAIHLQGDGLATGIDPAGITHVLYEANDGLRQAFGNPVNNSEYVPVPWGDQADRPTMAVDAEGSLHVAYINVPGAIDYLRRNSTTWNLYQQYTVPGGSVGGVAIAASSASDAQIAYSRSDGLHLLRWSGSAWIDDHVSTTPVYSSVMAIAVDPSTSAAHIVFFDTSQRVVYTHWTGTQWSEQVLAPSSVAGGDRLGIELDPSGYPVIAFPRAAGGIQLAH
jgi:hypothetical protein